MIESIDGYYGEKYNRKTNNCLHFAAKVWADLTDGEFQGVFDFLHGKCSLSTAKKFTRLPEPVSPCIVVFKGGNNTHIGVYLRGRVLHLVSNGVQYQPLSIVSISYFKTRFYVC